MELARFFFSMQDQIKLYHWQTKSYARHIATDQLHTALLPLIDRFMEVWQGKHNSRINLLNDRMTVTVGQLSDAEMDEFLAKCVEHLQRLEGSNLSIKSTDTDLLNIRDDMVGQINQTLYLFSFK